MDAPQNQPPPYSHIEQVPMPPLSAGRFPAQRAAEQRAEIERELGTLAVANAMRGTHQPK